jgi:hypothetical protein
MYLLHGIFTMDYFIVMAFLKIDIFGQLTDTIILKMQKIIV